jgi:hypothetical protein
MFTSITFTMNDHAISIVRKLKLKLLRFNYDHHYSAHAEVVEVFPKSIHDLPCTLKVFHKIPQICQVATGRQ